MRRDPQNNRPDDLPDGLTVVQHVNARDLGGWPLVFAAALIVILGLGGL